MILNEFRKIGIIVGLIFVVTIFIVTRRWEFVVCYILGYLVSNINLFLNSFMLDLSGGRSAFAKNFTNFLVRIALYALAMILAYKWMDLEGMICTFLGCLVIRIAILIHGIKGGINSGNNQ